MQILLGMVFETVSYEHIRDGGEYCDMLGPHTAAGHDSEVRSAPRRRLE
jgi:hypothetical protein